MIDGTQGPLADFQTFPFPAGWTDLAELRFTVSGITLDNLVLQGTPVPDAAIPPLPNGVQDFQVLATLPPNSTSWIPWQIHRTRGRDVLLAELNNRGAPDRYLLVQGNGTMQEFGPTSNPGTGDSARDGSVPAGGDEVYAKQIYLRPGGNAREVLLATNAAPYLIEHVNIMRPEAGRVAFVSHWYGGAEEYAVFVAQPGELIPVVKPDTVLPDGGTPYHFPYQLCFEDQTVAFTSSTSLGTQDDCWFLLFPGKDLLFGFREGATVPGFTEKAEQAGKLLSLNRERALYYMHGASHSWLMETSREGIHRVLGVSGPILNRPVAGCGLRCIAGSGMTSIDPVTGIPYYYDAAASADERGVTSGVNLAEISGKLLPVCAGAHFFHNLDAPACPRSEHTEAGTSLAVLADQSRNLPLRFTAVPQTPVPRLGDALTLPGGEIRFAAEYLTLDGTILREVSSNPDVPWLPDGSFTPGSINRTVPLHLNGQARRFLRLRYPE